MTSEPQAPKAPAIYLYRQVDRDDTSPDETVYVRIKILTEEGRKYANVEIPYFRDSESIRAIQARTIKPNGEISVFNGQIFDNTVVKYRGQRYINKTFTIPDVPVGSIIEYQFRRDMAEYYVFNSRWILSADLFTKHAKFSLQRYTGFSLRWTWPYGLPPGTDPPKEVRDVIRLETHDVPAFVSEDYMPPEDLMKYRVEFIYESTDNDERESAAYWKHYGKRRFHDVEDFVDARRAMAGAVAQVVAPDDPPEVKLQKLYARVQQIRNISFERDKTAEEEKREHLKPIGDVGDVWKRGYGNGEQITWLLLALARAAGLQADALLVATRDQYFFNPDEMNGNQLNTNVVVVKLNDKDVFLDPGTAFTPYGVLPWSETGVTGLRLSKDGGNWQTIPMPLVAQSKVLCQGRMQLKDNGTLEGKLMLTFTGYEAQTLRLEERHEDPAARTRYLERQVEDRVPMGIEARLSNAPDWDSSSSTLVAEFNLSIPGWLTSAGHRLLAPATVFGAADSHLFEHPARLYPIYFQYPHAQDDDLVISLPPTLGVASVPKSENIDTRVLDYRLDDSSNGNELHLQRHQGVNSVLIAPKFYGTVVDFYQRVRTGDEQQIVLSPAKKN